MVGIIGITMLADMIEVGSFIGLAAMTGSELTIKDAGVKHLGLIPDVFRKLGIQFDIRNDDIPSGPLPIVSRECPSKDTLPSAFQADFR